MLIGKPLTGPKRHWAEAMSSAISFATPGKSDFANAAAAEIADLRDSQAFAVFDIMSDRHLKGEFRRRQ